MSINGLKSTYRVDLLQNEAVEALNESRKVALPEGLLSISQDETEGRGLRDRPERSQKVAGLQRGKHMR